MSLFVVGCRSHNRIISKTLLYLKVRVGAKKKDLQSISFFLISGCIWARGTLAVHVQGVTRPKCASSHGSMRFGRERVVMVDASWKRGGQTDGENQAKTNTNQTSTQKPKTKKAVLEVVVVSSDCWWLLLVVLGGGCERLFLAVVGCCWWLKWVCCCCCCWRRWLLVGWLVGGCVLRMWCFNKGLWLPFFGGGI